MKSFMLFLALTGLAVSSRAGCAPAPNPSSASWAFAVTHTNADGTPHTRVFLRIGARRVLVAPDVEEAFRMVSRQEYKEMRIPVAAVAACSGWWAGQGEDFYVVRRSRRWEVFRRDLDEEAPIPAYRRVRSIRMH